MSHPLYVPLAAYLLPNFRMDLQQRALSGRLVGWEDRGSSGTQFCDRSEYFTAKERQRHFQDGGDALIDQWPSTTDPSPVTVQQTCHDLFYKKTRDDDMVGHLVASQPTLLHPPFLEGQTSTGTEHHQWNRLRATSCVV